MKQVLSGGVKVLVYSGNNDLVCSVSSTRYWIHHQLNESDTGKSVTNWTSWHVADDVGGWYEEWEQFAFMVVRDAGHEVPEYQPVRAYSLFQRFLNWNYADTPIQIEHAEWMGIEEDNGLTPERVMDIGMGIAIGIGICVLIGCLCGGCIMCFRSYRNRQKRNALDRALIQ